MNTYPKINTLWERDEKGRIIRGRYAVPEFEYLKDAQWVFTEKVDGTNIRVNWDGLATQFGGRTDDAQIHNGLVQYLRDTFTDAKLGGKFGFDAATLYGEGYGAKIGKGGGNYKPDGQSFALFDVRIGDFWLKRDAICEIATALNIHTVPVFFTGTLAEAEAEGHRRVQERVGRLSGGGLVGKPVVELHDRRGERIIVKMKTRDYVVRVQDKARWK